RRATTRGPGVGRPGRGASPTRPRRVASPALDRQQPTGGGGADLTSPLRPPPVAGFVVPDQEALRLTPEPMPERVLDEGAPAPSALPADALDRTVEVAGDADRHLGRPLWHGLPGKKNGAPAERLPGVERGNDRLGELGELVEHLVGRAHRSEHELRRPRLHVLLEP